MDAAELDISEIRQAQGTADGDTDMGAYTGTVLSSGSTVKANTQELGTQVDTNVSDIAGKEDAANKGIANGYCPLDASSVVPSINLPSYVDDVLEFANLAAFPVTGETGKIYVALDTNFMYRWSGTVYIDVTSKVDSVNSQTGVVVLDADDISDTATTNKYATQAQLDKVNHLAVTQAVDLDTMESDIGTNNAKVSASGSVDSHSDVDVTTLAPIVGDILEYDGTNFVPVVNSGGGSGQGGINFITNPDFETDLSGWVSYDDGAVSEPVDGSGGAPGISFARETNAVNVLRGGGTLAITKGASDQQGEGVSTDFTVDRIDSEKSVKLNISFNLRINGVIAAGDLGVYVYDVDGASLLGKIDDIAATNISGVFRGVFYTTAGNNDYRLIVHIQSVTTNSLTIYLDDFKVSPEEFAPGAIIVARQTFVQPIVGTGGGTLAIGTGGAAIQKMSSSRYGEDILIRYLVRIGTSGATDVTGAYLFPIPTGITLDQASYDVVGYGDVTTPASANPVARLTAKVFSGRIIVDRTDTNLMAGGDGVLFTNANQVSIFVRAKVVGWKASNLVSSTESLFSTAMARYTRGTNQSIPNSTVTVIDYATLSFDDLSLVTTGASWAFVVPKKGKYLVNSGYAIADSAAWVAGENHTIFIMKNGSEWSKHTKETEDGTTNLRMQNQLSDIVDCDKGDTINISIQQLSGGAINLEASSSLNFVTINSLPDFSAFGVHGETELIEAGSSAQLGWPFAAGVVGDLTSISLTPGEWDITAFMGNRNSGTLAGYSDHTLGISTVSASIAGLLNGENKVFGSHDSVGFQASSLSIPRYKVTVTNTTTYYLVAVSAIQTNFQYVGYKISARRIK